LKVNTVVAVDSKVLDRYVGRYGDPPNLILTIRREGDHLSVQENDEPKQELFPENELLVFSKVADDVYSFELDSQGRVTVMTLHTGGKDIPLKRID
jgi:hypothetical protein